MRFLDLHDFLMSDRAPATAMLLSGLDGFLTGLAVSPVVVTPSEWFDIVWGADGPPVLDDDKEVQAIYGAIISRFQEIGRALDIGRPDALDPIFWSTPDGDTLAADWAQGFVQAVRLRRDTWWPLIEDRDGITYLGPMLALSTDENGDPPFDLSLPGIGELYRDAPDLIPEAVTKIDRFWRKRRGAPAAAAAVPVEPSQAGPGPEPRRASKVGRNQLCPCGSGRKYKMCCGR